jgi:hypothetical protein
MPDKPPLADPGSTPRILYRGQATREPALFDEQPIGPLRGRVTVTPIRRLDRSMFFEVAAAWGPNPDGSDVRGYAGLPSHRVNDGLYATTQDGAVAVARTAVDELRAATSSDPHAGAPTIDLPRIARRLGVDAARF